MSELAEIKVVQQKLEQVQKNFSPQTSPFCRCFGLTLMFDRIEMEIMQ